MTQGSLATFTQVMHVPVRKPYLLRYLHKIAALSPRERTRVIGTLPEVFGPLGKRGLENVWVYGDDIWKWKEPHLRHPERSQEARERERKGDRISRRAAINDANRLGSTAVAQRKGVVLDATNAPKKTSLR